MCECECVCLLIRFDRCSGTCKNVRALAQPLGGHDGHGPAVRSNPDGPRRYATSVCVVDVETQRYVIDIESTYYNNEVETGSYF